MPQIFTIGRNDGNASTADILLEGSTISGMHAKVRVDNNRLYVTDIGSRNGTWVISGGNKRKVDAGVDVFVGSGDILQFGESQYSVDAIFSKLPSPSPEPSSNSTQTVVRCTHCGSVTFPGRPCVKCSR